MVFMRGGSSIEGAEFYHMIGRADLVAQHNSRRKRRIELFASGSALIPVGIGIGLGLLFAKPMYGELVFDDSGHSYERKSNLGYFASGIAITAGLSAAGIAMTIVGAVMNPIR